MSASTSIHSAQPGRLAIARAIPPGSRRPRTQRDCLRAAARLIAAQPWYGPRKDRVQLVYKRLVHAADWTDKTTRPGHGYLACPPCRGDGYVGPDTPCPGCGGRPMSGRTVTRAIAALRALGLLGLVQAGSTPDTRPMALAGSAGNLAAVYVCVTPRKPPLTPRRGRSGTESVTPTRFCKKRGLYPRAREPRAGKREEYPEYTRRVRDPHRSEKRASELAVARAVQNRCRPLAVLSAAYVRHLIRPYTAANPPWPAADIAWAFTHQLGGRRDWHTTEIKHPAAHARHRFAQHLDPVTGLPGLSPTQLAADRRDREAREMAGYRPTRPAAEVAATYEKGAALLRPIVQRAAAAALERGPPRRRWRGPALRSGP